MKHRLIALLFFLWASWTGLTAQNPSVLTLEECYEKAEKNYPLIRKYDLLESTRDYTLNNLARSWLPQLSLQARASYQTGVTKLPFDGNSLSAFVPGFEVPELSKDQYRLIAELEQPLWNGGETQAARAVARAHTEAEQAELDARLYALRSRINQLYFGCLLQDELLLQNRLLEENLQHNVERVQSLMDNGLANVSDADRLQVELLKVRQQAIALESQQQKLRQLLGYFIHQPVTEKVRLEQPDLPRRPMTDDIQRPELRAFQSRQDWFEAQNRQITASLMPRFGAFIQGGYGRPGLDMLDDEFQPFCIFGVSMTWNFSGLYTFKNRRRQLENNRKGVDVQREIFLFNTRLQLLEQDAEIRKMEKLEQTDAEIVRLRSRIKAAAEVKLQEGVISVNDVIDEIYAENQARQQASLHRLQRLMTWYDRLFTTN